MEGGLERGEWGGSWGLGGSGGERRPFGTQSAQRVEGFGVSEAGERTGPSWGVSRRNRPGKQWSEGDSGVSVCGVLDFRKRAR